MEFRKNERSNLENRKTIFFLLGMVLILSITYAAINVKSYEKFSYDYEMVVDDDLVELPPIVPPPPPALPPPPPAKPPVEPIIELVEDDKKTDEPEIEDLNIETIEVPDEPVAEAAPEAIEDVPMMRVSDYPHYPECGAIKGEERKRCTEKMFRDYINNNYVVPDIAREMGYSGVVYVKFVVSREGKITNVEILKSVNELLDKEAIRVVKSMPPLIPGKNFDRPVSVIFIQPINIK